MFFKANYSKMQETSNLLISKTQEINKLYLELIDLCKLVDENWQSEDSSIYILQFMNFIKEKMQENEQMLEVGKVLGSVSSLYMEQDTKWATDIINNDIERKS